MTLVYLVDLASWVWNFNARSKPFVVFDKFDKKTLMLSERREWQVPTLIKL